MIEPVRLHLDTANLQLSGPGFVSCTIYLQIGDRPFPHEGWVDLASQLIPPWAEQVSDVIQGRSDTAECCFMEGPYSFLVTVAGHGVMCIRPTTFGGNPSTVHTVMQHDFVESLLLAANLLSRAIKLHGVDTPDSAALSRSIEILRRLRAKLGMLQ